MKKTFVTLGILLCLAILTGCGNKITPIEEQPEFAPICPEGYYWIDSIKSCTLILEE